MGASSTASPYGYADPPATDRGDMTPLSREEGAALRDLLATCPDGFVSFQDHGWLQANPAPSNHCMPAATYGFPCSHLLPILDGLATHGRGRDRLYNVDWYGFVRRPYAFTFRLEGNVVDDGYRGFLRDAEAFLACAPGKGAEVVATWMRQHRVDDVDHKRLFWALEKAVDAELGSFDVGGFACHPDKPAAWRDAFLAAGVAAFVDRRSFLTGDLWQQVAVFDEGALRDVVRHDNPCFLGAPTFSP